MHDFVMVDGSDLWEIIYDGPYIPMKIIKNEQFQNFPRYEENMRRNTKIGGENFKAKRFSYVELS